MNRSSLAPLAGVLFLVLAILGFIIGGEPKEASDGADAVVEWYTDNEDSAKAGAFVVALSAVPLLIFAAYLRGLVSAARGAAGWIPPLILTGATILAVGIAIDSTILLAAADAADDIEPASLVALQALWDNDFVPLALGAVIFLLSSGISIVQTGVLPKWLGWIAILLAVIGMTPIGFVGAIGGAVWILIASVMLAMRGDRADDAAPRPAA
jgi:hypothetical protein